MDKDVNNISFKLRWVNYPVKDYLDVPLQEDVERKTTGLNPQMNLNMYFFPIGDEMNRCE